MSYPKLRSSVSVVSISEVVLEFFKTNTRQQIRIKVNDDTIMNIICSLDGSRSIEEIANEFGFENNIEELEKLLNYLWKKGILDNIQNHNDFEYYSKYRRVINFLEDYSESHSELVSMWDNVRNSRVMIIGLGAVGSWLAINLVQSGVKNFILMDSDIVDLTNLHRQFGYNESDIGKKKIDVLAERMCSMEEKVDVIKIDSFLNENVLEKTIKVPIDLIVNCADKPNVDTTSLWVGKYCMEHNIPHIVGGGYNLHLSLIGQTVIPYKTACVKCFEKQLEEDNTIDPKKVKKLNVLNRKVGSFGPMCSMIASMVGMESIKILTKKIEPANVNRRGEFNIYNMEIKYKTFIRRDDCEWCGKK